MFSKEVFLLLIIGLQLVSISFVAPAIWVINQYKMYHRYPPKYYPLYYVFTAQQDKLIAIIRVALDLIVAMLCVFVVVPNMLFVEQANYMTFWATLTFIQLLPSAYTVFTLTASGRRRKIQNKPIKIKVSFKSRSVLDYLPIHYVGLLLISVGLSSYLILSNELYSLYKKVALIVLFGFTLGALIISIQRTIFGKLFDKQLNEQDRQMKRVQDVQRSMVGIGLTSLVFAYFSVSSQPQGTSSILSIIPLSLFIQILILTRIKRWHAQDMSVYRRN